MGSVLTVHAKYQRCVSDSNFHEVEEEVATPRSVLEEPVKLTEKVVEKFDSFKTLAPSK